MHKAKKDISIEENTESYYAKSAIDKKRRIEADLSGTTAGEPVQKKSRTFQGFCNCDKECSNMQCACKKANQPCNNKCHKKKGHGQCKNK